MNVWNVRTLVFAPALAASACASSPAPPLACALPESDRAWVDRAVEAWRFASREITGIARLGALIERYKLPDEFNDDSLQKRFEQKRDRRVRERGDPLVPRCCGNLCSGCGPADGT